MYSYPHSSYTSPQPSSASKPLFSYPHTTSHSRRMPALNAEPLSLSSYLDDPDHPFYHSHSSSSHSGHSGGHHTQQSADAGWGDSTPPSPSGSEATLASMHTTAALGSSGHARKHDRGGSGHSPSNFLFDSRPRSPDPVHIHDDGQHHRRHDMPSGGSLEEQRAMLILTGRGAGGGPGANVSLGGGVGSAVTSPQLSPASACTGGSEHHMALSPLSAQSSQSSQHSHGYTTCGSSVSHHQLQHQHPHQHQHQLLPPAAPMLPPPPQPRTPTSTRKRKSPPLAVKEDLRSVHVAHIQHQPQQHQHHQHQQQQQQHHVNNRTPDRLLSHMPAFTPSPLAASVHSTPSPLVIDTHGGSHAPPPTAASQQVGRDEFWHSLSLLQSQPPLSLSSSCASSPASVHGSPGTQASHHAFFHPQQQPPQHAQRIQSTPPLVMASPSSSLHSSPSYQHSPLHGMSPLHSLHIYSPSHGQPSPPNHISPPAPLFAPASTASSAASSAAASPPPTCASSVAVAATQSSSLTLVSPHFSCPLPVVSVSLDCSLLEATPAFFSLFHIPSPSHLAHLSLFSLLHAGSCLRVLSALLSLAEGDCEREAVSAKGCKLSADAIIRTGMKSMNPQQQQQQQPMQPVRAAAPVSANNAARGVVAAVIGGVPNRPASAFSFEQRGGAAGGADKGGAMALPATNTSSILLHLAVDSCAYALHHMLEAQRRSPTAASPHAASDADGGGGGELELSSAWLGGALPVSAMCFDCQLLIAPVVDAAGSMHRFLVVVSEVKRRPAPASEEAEGDEGEREERLRDMVEERVRRWREGNGGKKRRRRAKVDRTAPGKKLAAQALIKRETSCSTVSSNGSGSLPARKAAKTSEGKRKVEE